MYIWNTNMLFWSHYMYESLPLQLIHHLHQLSHACTLITQATTTTDNVLYKTPEGTPMYRLSTHSPCHEQQDLTCSAPLQASPRQHVFLELPRWPCCIQDHQCYAAWIPCWGPGIWSYQHGPPLQLCAGHCVRSTKRESKREIPER